MEVRREYLAQELAAEITEKEKKSGFKRLFRKAAM